MQERPWSNVTRLAVCAAAALGCSEAPERIGDTEAPRPVRTARVSAGPGARSHVFSGRLQAPREAPASFRVGGRVEEVRVDVGDRFDAGDVLATLEPVDARLRARRAAAALDAARSRRRTAEADLQRTRRLYEAGNASERALDRARDAATTARADVASARRALRLRRRSVGYATLEAPIAGTVVERRVEPGATVAAAQPVLVYAATGGLEAVFVLPPERVPDLAVGDAVEVRPAAGAEGPLDARVTEIARAVAARSPGYPVTAVLDDPPASLRPGTAARVAFAGAAPDAPRVPLEAVARDSRGTHVLVVEEDGGGDGAPDDEAAGDGAGDPERTGTVARRAVEVGALDRFGVIVRGGVSPGERVVTAGLQALSDGDTVRLDWEPPFDDEATGRRPAGGGDASRGGG